MLVNTPIRLAVMLIAAVLLVAFYSLSIAQDVPQKATWFVVEPNFVPPNIYGKKIKIKIGPSYKFVNYNVYEQLKIAMEYLWRPLEANSKRVLTMYDLGELSLMDMKMIDRATPDEADPPIAAFLLSTDEGAYIGTPFKWNKQIGDTMRAAVSLEQKYPKLKAGKTMVVFADDVLAHAAFEQMKFRIMGGTSISPQLQVDEALKSLGAAYNVYAKWNPEDLKMLLEGNPDPIEVRQPHRPIYFGINFEIVGLSAKPVGKVISISGAGGERLGYSHPAWPVED